MQVSMIENSDPLENSVAERINGISETRVSKSPAHTLPGGSAATPQTSGISLQLQTPPAELQLPESRRSTLQMGTIGATSEKLLQTTRCKRTEGQ